VRELKATLLWSIPWDDDAVTSIAFVGANRIAAGNEQGTIYLFDLAETGPIAARRLDGHTNVVTSLVSPSDGKLVSSSYDHTLRWWDVAAEPAGSAEVVLEKKKKTAKPVPVKVGTQKAAGVTEAHEEWVRSLSLGAQGRQILSGDDKGMAILWDSAEAREIRRFPSAGWIRTVALTRDGRLAATCEYAPRYAQFPNAIKLWDAESGKLKLDLGREFKKGDRVTGMAAAAFSPDGRILALGQGGEVEGGKGKVFLVDPEGAKKPQELAGHEYGVTGLAFNLDGAVLASAGRDTVVRLWSMSDGKMLQELGKPRGGQFKDWIHAVAFSPDGSRLAAADMAGQVHVWSLA
jgi:WD40 repeat protein